MEFGRLEAVDYLDVWKLTHFEKCFYFAIELSSYFLLRLAESGKAANFIDLLCLAHHSYCSFILQDSCLELPSLVVFSSVIPALEQGKAVDKEMVISELHSASKVAKLLLY